MIDLKYIDFLNLNKLSSEEFTIAYFIYQDKQRDDINEKFELYIENNADKFDYKKLLVELEDKEYIINLNKIGNYELSKIKVTDKFVNMLFIDKDLAFKQFKEIYPKSLNFNEKNGNTISTKLYPSFGNESTDSILYYNFTEGRRDKHFKVLEITRRYIEANDGKAVYKFENYLDRFNAIAEMFDEQIAKDNFEFDVLT